jgi:hypothetical protein
MKKFISLAICLVMAFTLCVPVFAAGKHTEYKVMDGEIDLWRKEDVIISSGDYAVDHFIVNLGCTLIIGKDAAVTVNGGHFYYNKGTIIVLGALTVNTWDVTVDQYSQICVVGCTGGTVTGNVPDGNVKTVPHFYENGVCIGCGCECPHANGFSGGKCNNCGMVCPHKHTTIVCDDCGKKLESASTSSVISQGYPEIVFGIGGLAVGFFAAMLIFRKKKVVVSSASADDEE